MKQSFVQQQENLIKDAIKCIQKNVKEKGDNVFPMIEDNVLNYNIGKFNNTYITQIFQGGFIDERGYEHKFDSVSTEILMEYADYCERYVKQQ